MELESITGTLKKLIEAHGGEDWLWERVINTVISYMPQIKKNLAVNTNDTLKDIMRAIDAQWAKSEGEKFSCRKGCSYCCKMNVDISSHEAKLLIDHCKENGIVIDKEYLGSQALGTMDNWHLLENIDCVFLKDNQCSVYSVRPFACRNYHVVTDPKLCDTIENKGAQPAQAANMNIEIFMSAYVNCVDEWDSLPQMLLKLM